MPRTTAIEAHKYPGDVQLTASEIVDLHIRIYDGFDLIVFPDALNGNQSILSAAANLYTQLVPLVVSSQALALVPAPAGMPHIFAGTQLPAFAKDVTALASRQLKGLLRRLHWAEGVLTGGGAASNLETQAAEMFDAACASYVATIALLRMCKPFFDHVGIQIALPSLTTGDTAAMISSNIAAVTNAQAWLENAAQAIPD